MICKTCKKELPDGEFYLYTKGERMLMRKDCKPCYRIERSKKKGRPEPKRKKLVEEPPKIFDLHMLWGKVVRKELR